MKFSKKFLSLLLVITALICSLTPSLKSSASENTKNITEVKFIRQEFVDLTEEEYIETISEKYNITYEKAKSLNDLNTDV